MKAVRSPEVSSWRYNRNDGIEEATCFTDDIGQPLVMRVGEITLKRRRINLIYRKN
jgi:hypothetical protein